MTPRPRSYTGAGPRRVISGLESPGFPGRFKLGFSPSPFRDPIIVRMTTIRKAEGGTQ